MKKLLLAATVLLAGATAHAAQKTPTAVKAEINTSIVTNGALRATTLNSIMTDVADSYGGTLVANTWASAQTFSVSPIISTLTGYLKGNGASALTASASIPLGDVSGLGTNVATWLATPSSANLAAALTDETGSGSLVFGTSPTISGHPTVEGVTSTGATGTGKFVFDTSPTIATPVISGVTDASSASTGKVGEVISSNVVAASKVSQAVSGTVYNITSISLTAGDWDVRGMCFVTAAGTTQPIVNCGINSTSATHMTDATANGYALAGQPGQYGAGTPMGGQLSVWLRVNINSTTTYYLMSASTYTGTAPGAYGVILARRIR